MLGQLGPQSASVRYCTFIWLNLCYSAHLPKSFGGTARNSPASSSRRQATGEYSPVACRTPTWLSRVLFQVTLTPCILPSGVLPASAHHQSHLPPRACGVSCTVASPRASPASQGQTPFHLRNCACGWILDYVSSFDISQLAAL